eukprot:tig00020553_g10599.t1
MFEPPKAADLRAALAPFDNLRSLAISFGSLDVGITAETATAIAGACPLLRAFRCGLHRPSVNAVLAALAPLGRLEELSLPMDGGEYACDISDGVLALAEGPAGRTLRRIALARDRDRDVATSTSTSKNSKGRRGRGRGRQQSFLNSSDEDASRPVFEPSGAALLGLCRMPNLESVYPLRIRSGLDARAVAPGDVLALGGAAGLREVHLALDFGRCFGADRDRAPGLLRALGEALSSLPRLERLRLGLDGVGRHVPPEGVATLLGSPGARRALTDLRLELADRPLSGAEAAAIAALPALEGLRLPVEPSMELGSCPPLEPFQTLARMRPEVAASVYLHWEEGDWELESNASEIADDLELHRELRAAVRRMFAGRRPERLRW